MTLLFMVSCAEAPGDNTIEDSVLNACVGQPDSDNDGLCDRLEQDNGTDPNNKDDDDDGIDDGDDLQPFIPGTGGTNTGGGGSIQQDGDTGGTSPWIALLGFALTQRSQTALQKFIRGDDGNTTQPAPEVTVNTNVNLVREDLGDSPKAQEASARLEAQRLNIEDASHTSDRIDVDFDASYLKILLTDGSAACAGRSYVLVTNVVGRYQDEPGSTAGEDFVLSYVRYANVINERSEVISGAAYRVVDLVEQSASMTTMGSDRARDAIQATLNQNDALLASCAFSGPFFYSPDLEKTHQRFKALAPNWFGMQFNNETGTYDVTGADPVSIAIPTFQDPVRDMRFFATDSPEFASAYRKAAGTNDFTGTWRRLP